MSIISMSMDMHTKKIITFSAIALIIVGIGTGYFLSQKKESKTLTQEDKKNQAQSDSATNTPTSQDEKLGGESFEKPQPLPVEAAKPFITYVVVYTDSGYLPPNLSIKKGDNVTFKNRSKKNMWTASAMHPSHREYPTTGGCVGSTFDSCKNIPPEEEWSFTFDLVGTWKY